MPGDPALVLLGALAGALFIAAAREAVLASPALARWVVSSFEPLLRAGREGYTPSEAERRRLAVLGSAALGTAGLVLAGPGPAPVLALAGPAAAAWALGRRGARYRRAVERKLPELSVAIADALTGGRSVRAALAGAGASLDGPAAVEMARVAADIELGAPTGTALRELQRRLNSPRVDTLVAALTTQQLAGGDLALLLRRYAAAAGERDRVAEDARAATAQARFTGLLVVAMPSGAALFAELLEPGFLARLLSEPASMAMLAIAGALQAAGFWAIRRLSRVEA